MHPSVHDDPANDVPAATVAGRGDDVGDVLRARTDVPAAQR